MGQLVRCVCVYITNTSLFLFYFSLCFILSVSSLSVSSPTFTLSLFASINFPLDLNYLLLFTAHIIAKQSTSTFFTHFSSFIVSVWFQLCLQFPMNQHYRIYVFCVGPFLVLYVFRFTARTHCK